jgi:hypothetical protein
VSTRYVNFSFNIILFVAYQLMESATVSAVLRAERISINCLEVLKYITVRKIYRKTCCT